MKVKIRKTRGVTGNQKNYGLITGSIWNYEDKPSSNNVGTTLSPIPRDEANIEAERGETVVFPDTDGNVAHAKIGGKRHFEGGTPLNVPDGSFVFSDFRDLNIKNKDLLKNVFNMNSSKAVTPADVAKRYEINKYKEILNNPWADPMDKKTAQLMIDNNMKKLGQLALVQEGMKGFPDGIPDIAKPLFASDLAQSQPMAPQQEQPQARYGGLPKHQTKGSVTNTPTGNLSQKVMVDKANQIYNQAVKSGDYKAMRKAAEELSNINVPKSLSTPLGTTAEILRGLGTGLAGFFSPIYNEFGYDSPNFHSTEPWGATWQEKVNDMKDQLEYQADQLQEKQNKTKYQTQDKKTLDAYKTKYNEVQSSIQNILSNPGKYNLDIVQKAVEWDQKINDPIIPKPTRLLGVNPYTLPHSENSSAGKIIGNAHKELVTNPIAKAKPAVSVELTNSPVGVYDIGNFNSNIPYRIPATTQPTTTTQPRKTPTLPRKKTEEELMKEAGIEKFGGNLRFAQTGLQYNIEDPELMKLQNEEIEFVRPDYYNPKFKKVGPQLTGSTNYKRLPSGEIVPEKLDIKSPTGTKYTGIDDLINYADPFINFEDYDTTGNDKATGIAKWKADLADPKKRDQAGEWYANRVNEYNRLILGPNAPLTIDTGIKGWNQIGLENLTVPFARRKAKAAETAKKEEAATTPTKTEMTAIPKTVYQKGIEKAPWWNYNTVNAFNQLMNYGNIEPGALPLHQQFTPYIPDYTLMDPARALANVQENVNASNRELAAFQDPNVARANIIANQAKAAPTIADVISKYDQGNIGITNQAESQAASMINNAQLRNMQMNKEYADEVAIRRQQYMNALKEGRTDVAKSIMEGMKNAAETAWVNATSDSYSVDPTTGNIYFKRGFDPKTGQMRSSGSSPAEQFLLYTDPNGPYKLSREEAIDLITGTKKDNKSVNVSATSQYAFGGAFYNPTDLLWNH